MSKVAVYPGSFDPITFGHIDIAKRALKLFDHLIIMISVNPSKKTLFTAQERKWLVEQALLDEKDRIKVVINEDLTVNKARELGATHIVRGLRAVTDFEYEFQMTTANRVLDHEIDSVFFMTDSRFSFLSSNNVKEIARFKGELDAFVPEIVKQKLNEKYSLN